MIAASAIGATILLTSPEARAGDPVRPGLIGVGINNTTSIITNELGLVTTSPPAVSVKYYLNHDNAIVPDLGFAIAATKSPGGREGHFFMAGFGYEHTFHTLEHGHFFGRAVGHFAHWDNVGPGGPGGVGGTASAVNLGVYAGWEYIFDKGLPGLGISAEFGLNSYLRFPDIGDPQFLMTFGGLGGLGAAPSYENVLVLGIRYYFMP